MRAPSLFLCSLLAFACGASVSCDRVRSIATGGESELEKQRRRTQEQQRLEKTAQEEMGRRAREDAARQAEQERKEVTQSVLSTLDQIAKLNAEMDRQARDPVNAPDFRARHLAEVHFSALDKIPLQDCPDDFADAAHDFVASMRAFSEYAYAQSAADIEYVMEILSKGPQAARLAERNLKPGPKKLIERYLTMCEAGLRYGVQIEVGRARLTRSASSANTAAPKAAPQP